MFKITWKKNNNKKQLELKKKTHVITKNSFNDKEKTKQKYFESDKFLICHLGNNYGNFSVLTR